VLDLGDRVLHLDPLVPELRFLVFELLPLGLADEQVLAADRAGQVAVDLDRMFDVDLALLDGVGDVAGQGTTREGAGKVPALEPL
jgi:hypothetical protein